MAKDCVFCMITEGKISAPVIWQDNKHIAFLSIFPNTNGFSVVATKKHFGSYAFDVEDSVLSELVLATKKVAKILDRTFTDVGRTGMFFEGFGVDHLHSKLFPMHGTADMSNWRPIEKDRKKVFFDKYPGYLSSHDAGKADEKELKEIANKIQATADKMKL